MSFPTENPGAQSFWDVSSLSESLEAQGTVANLKATERLLKQEAWLPEAVSIEDVQDEFGRGVNGIINDQLLASAKRKRIQTLVLQVSEQGALPVMMVNDGRMARRWRILSDVDERGEWLKELQILMGGKPALVWPHGEKAVVWARQLVAREKTHQLETPDGTALTFALTAYQAPTAITQ